MAQTNVTLTVPESHGWPLLFESAETGTVMARHTSGFYVAGFDTKTEAAVWLNAHLIAQQNQRARDERRQLRLLGQMASPGRVS